MQTAKKGTAPNKWRLMIASHLTLETMELRSAEAMRRLSNNMDRWERDQQAMPLPLLVEKIMYESGIVAHQMTEANHVWNIQVLHTFFEFVKDLHLRNPRIRAEELLMMTQNLSE
jgi:DNA helicase-2/ATP-dependent DNA helicase PcrA